MCALSFRAAALRYATVFGRPEESEIGVRMALGAVPSGNTSFHHGKGLGLARQDADWHAFAFGCALLSSRILRCEFLDSGQFIAGPAFMC